MPRYARARRKQTNSSRNALRLLTLPHKRIATWLGCVSTPANGQQLGWHPRNSDHITQVEGGGINFQPQILISCSSAGEDEEFIDISAAPEAAGGLPQQGNGSPVRGSSRRR